MQQNQVAEISGVKHPDNSKTVGDFFFYFTCSMEL